MHSYDTYWSKVHGNRTTETSRWPLRKESKCSLCWLNPQALSPSVFSLWPSSFLLQWLLQPNTHSLGLLCCWKVGMWPNHSQQAPREDMEASWKSFLLLYGRYKKRDCCSWVVLGEGIMTRTRATILYPWIDKPHNHRLHTEVGDMILLSFKIIYLLLRYRRFLDMFDKRYPFVKSIALGHTIS